MPSPLAPNVPTLAKALHQADVDATFRLVLQTASGTPAPIVAPIEQLALQIMQDPQVKARLQANDLVVVGSPAAQTQQLMASEMARWESLVRRLDLRSN